MLWLLSCDKCTYCKSLWTKASAKCPKCKCKCKCNTLVILAEASKPKRWPLGQHCYRLCLKSNFIYGEKPLFSPAKEIYSEAWSTYT